jgi:hypothetical protein
MRTTAHNARVASDHLHEAQELVRTGDLSEALKALDRAEAGFKAAGDASGLRAVLQLADEIEPHASGKRHRAKVRQITYAATQNIKFVERRMSLEPSRTSDDSVAIVPTPEYTVPTVRPVEILPATPLDMLSSKGRDAVAQGLMPGETVNVVIRGTSSSAVIRTDRRAFIYKQGLLAGATFGHKLASFAYENIVGIEVHTGAMSGAVVIHVPGAASVSTSYWHDSKSDPHRAYNAVPIMRPYAPAQAGAAQLRALIAEFSSGQRTSPPSVAAGPAVEQVPQGSDPLEAIRKLGELRDAGLVTPEEFESKKAELLSRL